MYVAISYFTNRIVYLFKRQTVTGIGEQAGRQAERVSTTHVARELARVGCPSELHHSFRTQINFEHPGAGKDATVGANGRELTLASALRGTERKIGRAVTGGECD